MLSSNNPCSILYLDCRGYYDLATDIVTAVIAFLVLIRSLHNFRELRMEQNVQNQPQYGRAIGRELRMEQNVQNQPQYGRAIGRKIIVNGLNIGYILTFQAHLIFSMILFQVINEMGKEGIVEGKLNLWYKFSEVLFVEVLNCLIVTVGWLYWKGLYSFYKIKEIPAPMPYRANFQYFFFIDIAIMIGVVIVGLVLPFIQTETLQISLHWLLVISQILSITIFLTFRLLYYRNILCSVRLSKNTLRKQKIHNFIILITSFGRVALCLLSITNIDFQSLRDYDAKICHDMKPYNAILLLFIGVLIDLIPPFIFTRIFVSLQRQSNSNVDQTLFSAVQSDYTIYTR